MNSRNLGLETFLTKEKNITMQGFILEIIAFDNLVDNDYVFFLNVFWSLTDENIFLSDAIHSATIEVDEHGTIATAATVLRMQARCAVFPMNIEFNKPFLFVLQLDETILFLGRFESPS